MRRDNELLRQCDELDEACDVFRGLLSALVLTGLGVMLAFAIFGN